MSYQVIARKWRPQSFTELVGQEHIAQTLLNALKNQRIPHALLFTGTRGVGKTSSARIFAKSLRCLNPGDNFNPCNRCDACTEIQNASSVDVIEIDGASNNGVDAIRELRDSVSYMPAKGKYKVYIIDEVHMLSNSAFNALLKTLEEPPSHVIFIFATTEVNKIPNTILSRCQRFDFRRMTSKSVAQHLEKICQTENILFNHDALWLIARQADGSMRDGLSLLDQIITFSESNIEKELVLNVLGLTDRQLLHQCLNAFSNKEAQLILNCLESIKTSGIDPLIFAKELLEEIRNLLILKFDHKQESVLLDLPESELQLLKDISLSFSQEDIHLLFDMVLKGTSDISRAMEPSLVLEILLLRMLNAPRIEFFTATSTPVKKKSPSTLTTNKSKTASPQNTNSSKSSAPAPAKLEIKSIYNKEKSLLTNWQTLVQQIKNQKPLLAAKLEHAAPVNIDEQYLYLNFSKNQIFLMEQLKEKKNDLKDYLQKLWLKKLDIDLKVADQNAAQHLSPAQANKLQKQKQRQDLEEKIAQHPLVQATNKIFETKIKTIKETRQ